MIASRRRATSSATPTRRLEPLAGARELDATGVEVGGAFLLRGTSRARCGRRAGRSTRCRRPSRRQNGSSSSWGTTWLTSPHAERGRAASRKLPVTLISRARRMADRLGEQHGEPPSRHDPDAGVGVGEAGPLGRDEEVARERDLEAAGDRGAVDRADHRLGRLGERADQLVARSRTTWRTSESVVSALEVDAGAERGIGAGEHDGVDVVARVARRDRLRERRGERGVQRVAGLRSVEGDDRHPVRHLHQDHVVAISPSTVPSIGARASRRTRPCLRGCRRWRGSPRWRPSSPPTPARRVRPRSRSSARRLGPRADRPDRADALRQRQRAGHRLTGLGDHVHQTERVGALGVEPVAGEQHLLGDVERQRARRAEQPAAGRHQAALHLGEPERRGRVPRPRDRTRARSRTRRRARVPRPRR